MSCNMTNIKNLSYVIVLFFGSSTAFSQDSIMNWTEIKHFDEYLNIVSNSKTYFDRTGRPIQQQTKTFSGNKIISGPCVIVSSTLRDIYNREVLTTLLAPTNRTLFNYMPDFIKVEAVNDDGEIYNFLNFDLGDKRVNPDPVEKDIPNTLGWYYSSNNTLERHVPVTSYPYSRIEYYDDGTGDVKRSSAPGEQMRIGTGHEVYTRSFGVSTELNRYMELRNKIFPLTDLTTLSGETVQSVTIDQNGNMVVSFSDRSGNLLMTARKGDWLMLKDSQFTITDGTGAFYLIQPAPVNISSSAELTNVRLGITSSYSSGTTAELPGGLYTVKAVSDMTINPVGMKYGFGDISYNFYDDAGRLEVSIAPNGVQQLLLLPDFNSLDVNNLPFATYYTYNHQDWLLSIREPDAGLTQYMYRRDGSIRFSQNARQAQGNRFSYTDYDRLGRPIESGEYYGTLAFGSTLDALLENQGFNPWQYTEKKDWVKTQYDTPDYGFSESTGLSNTQDFVIGAVSWTENEHITTWYSYDEQGRVTWMVQKPKALQGQVFRIVYNYDFLGNVLQVGFESFQAGVPIDRFYHYYVYDADKRLSSVYTSLRGDLEHATLHTNTDARIQACYQYYLHGPLKRIELGGDLQGIDFVYNLNGWLKQINHPDTSKDPGGDGNNGFKEDVFGIILNYYQSNMNNLFATTSMDIVPKPDQFHRLPGTSWNQKIHLASIFKVLEPGFQAQPYLKQFSAEKERNKEMLLQLLNNNPKNDG